MATATHPPIDPKDFYIHHQKNATIVRLPGSVHGLDLMIEDLDDCVVYLLDHSAQITVDYCNRTRFIVGPVDGPFFMRNCVGCTVTVACRQLRTRECTDSDFFLYCATKSPIIESSSNLRFHPFNVSYPGLRSHFAAAKLDPLVNHNDLIFDFSADDDSVPRPHSVIVPTIPTLVQLRCFDSDGQEVQGDWKDTPLDVKYENRVEERVEKAARAAVAAAPDTAAATPVATAVAAEPVLESFGSNSQPKFAAPAAAAPSAAADPITFDAGVAPSIPAFLQPQFAASASSSADAAQPSTENSATDAAPSVAIAATSSDAAAVPSPSSSSAPDALASPVAAASSGADASISTAPVLPAASATVEPVLIVKEASFSIHTSAEDASRALFALAGVAYVAPAAAAPKPSPAAAAAAAASAAAPPTEETALSPADEEARLAAWISAHHQTTVSPEQAALEQRVAEAERKRVEALEKRRQDAAAAAASSKAAAAASLQQFYVERQAEAEQSTLAESESDDDDEYGEGPRAPPMPHF